MDNKIILEGTDGVGKSSTIKALKIYGINCQDRSKDVISKYMLFDVDMKTRAKKYEQYLLESEDIVIFLINNNKEEITKRIYSRAKISEFDKRANEYNSLYLDTYNYMKKNCITHNKLFLIDCTNLDFNEQVRKIKQLIEDIKNA